MTSPPRTDVPAVTGKPFSWRFTTPLLIGSALNPINSSMIATALVPIAVSLGVPIGQTASLVTALYLASAIAQPTAGKLAAVFGARRVFLAGILLVLLGGFLGGVSQSLPMVLTARVLIGLGTSCAYPSAMMLIQRRAAQAGMEQPPGGVLGALQIAGMATAAIGLPIGGIIVETVGWRWVFLVNVPAALIALAAALLWIPRDPAQKERRNVRGILASIDLPGIIGFGLAMIALLLFLFSLQDPNWIMLAAAVVLFVALTLWELRAASPFLDVRLLVRNGALTRTYVRFALTALCVYVVMYGVTQWMEASRGISALSVGLLLLPMGVISGVIVAPISRRNLVRGPVIIAAVGSLLGSIGVFFLTSDTDVAWIVAITVVFGIVLGTASSGNQLALYIEAPPEQLGVASGLLRTFGYIGSIASSAIAGIVFHTNASDSGVRTIGVIMVAVSLVAIAFTVFDRSLRSPGRATHQP